MRTVYKYPIYPNSVKGGAFPIEVDAPVGAKPLFVGLQNRQCCLWMDVDPKQPSTMQTPLVCVGTGFGAIPDGASYFGSVVDDARGYVWHFFCVLNGEPDAKT